MGLQHQELCDSPAAEHNADITTLEVLKTTPSTCEFTFSSIHTTYEIRAFQDVKKSSDSQHIVDKSISSKNAGTESLEVACEESENKGKEKKKKKKWPHYRNEVIFDLPMDDPRWLVEKNAVETMIGYRFKNALLLREAMLTLKHCNAQLEDGTILTESNYGLAQKGDATLRWVLLDCWFGQQEDHKIRSKRGETQKRLENFISDVNLSKMADEKEGDSRHSLWIGILTAIRKPQRFLSRLQPQSRPSSGQWNLIVVEAVKELGILS